MSGSLYPIDLVVSSPHFPGSPGPATLLKLLQVIPRPFIRRLHTFWQPASGCIADGRRNVMVETG